MSTIIEYRKAEAVRDIQDYVLQEGADTAEAAFRELANKWWTILQQDTKGPQTESLRRLVSEIYRALLEHIAVTVKPSKEGRQARVNFRAFTGVLVKNMPLAVWHSLFLDFHDEQHGYVRTKLASQRPVDKGIKPGPNNSVEELRKVMRG